jgi:gliding motility-associated-like protein
MADFKENNFDEVLKKKLLNYEETPPEHIYNDLMEHFSNSSVSYTRKILSNKYLYIISSAIIIGIVAIKLYNSSNTKNINNLPKKSSITTVNNKSSENITIEVKNIQNNNPSDNTTQHQVNLSNSNNNLSMVKDEKLSSLSNNKGTIATDSTILSGRYNKINDVKVENTDPINAKVISDKKEKVQFISADENPNNISKDIVNLNSDNLFSVDVSFIITPASCDRNNGSITANISGSTKNLNYFWYPCENIKNTSNEITNINTGEYHLRVSDENNNEKVFNIFVPDSGKIIADFIHTELEQVISRPLYFNNNTKVNGKINPPGTTYIWSFGDGTYSFQTNPEHTYTSEGEFSVKLLAISKFGCTDSITLSDINISPSNPEAPNVFSPNGDGLNDIFKPKVKPSKFFTCTIFNQEGKTVFEWKDPNSGWDGKINNTPAAEGTYYFVIKGTGNDDRRYVLTGNLLLVRK